MIKKLFTEPVMEIKRFEAENIVTSSTGVEVSPESVSEESYSIMSLDVIKDLGFNFTL